MSYLEEYLKTAEPIAEEIIRTVAKREIENEIKYWGAMDYDIDHYDLAERVLKLCKPVLIDALYKNTKWSSLCFMEHDFTEEQYELMVSGQIRGGISQAINFKPVIDEFLFNLVTSDIDMEHTVDEYCRDECLCEYRPKLAANQ